jgi:hypothetical protein
MSPEFLEALKMIELPVIEPAEYRLYYDNDGCIVSLSERDHPNGDYIVLEDIAIFHNTNTTLLRVVNGELVVLDAQPTAYTGLQRSTTGQRVVKGMAALALTADEEYQTTEYYDRKTNH